ncbi:MAG: sigma 54-interacting transcriptional regulator [Candidatus Coatesbacteria bacterium]|nr:MAG: sigma 54-interacting transcriptional regulator [Candidatus Coatesbacteria bacterium]
MAERGRERERPGYGCVTAAGAEDPPAMFGERYEILARIGQTPTSEVFKAYDRKRRLAVAVKAVSKARVRPLALLRREFETLTYFDHPHIVRVYDFGEERERIFYTMDFLAPWQPYEDGGPVSLPYLYDFAFQILSALDYVHRRGIIHGDVKPTNIFEDTGEERRRFVLGDFGLFRQIGEDGRYPVSGTMEYIAPEVFQGVMDDPRSDLYSFGILLFRLISRRLPFLPGDDISRIKKKPRYNYLRLSEVMPGVYPELDDYTARLLQHDPANRFFSAYEATTALAELASAAGVPLSSQTRPASDLASGKFFGYEKEVEAVFRGREEGETAAEVFVVEGPPGVGKTTFLRECGKVAQLQGGWFGYADASGGEGIGEVLRAELGGAAPPSDVEPEGEEVSRTLEAAFAAGSGREARRAGAVPEALSRLSVQHDGVVVALDHVDADDPGEWRSVVSLVSFPYPRPVKFLVAFRRGAGATDARFGPISQATAPALPAARRLTLRGFSPSTVQEYLRFALGVPVVDPVLLQYVQDRAQGNPGFTRNLIEAAVAAGVIQRRWEGWFVDPRRLKDMPLPPEGADYAADVFKRTEEDDLRALAPAAIYGYRFPSELIASKGVLGRGLRAGVLVRREGFDGGMSFANAGVYEYLEAWTRENYLAPACRQVLEFVERPGYDEAEAAAVKGRTYLLGGEVGQARAALSEAAQLARRAGEAERAIELWEAALSTAGEWERETYAAALADLAEAYSAVGDHRKAVAYYEKSRRAAEPRETDPARTVIKMARERLALAEFEKPARVLRELAPAELAPEDRFLREALLAWAEFKLADMAAATTHVGEAYRLAEELDRRDLLAFASYVAGVVADHGGDSESALHELTRAARFAEEMGRLRLASIALNFAGDVWCRRADHEKAVEVTRRSLELARNAQDRYAVASSFMRLGWIYFDQGYVKRAQEAFDRAEAECKLIGNDDLLAAIYFKSALNMIRAGEYRQGDFYLDLIGTLPHAPPTLQPYIRYHRATLGAERGQYEAALAELAAAEQGFTAHKLPAGAAWVRSLRGRVYYLRGDYEAAHHELAANMEALAHAADKHEYAKALLTLGELAREEGDEAAAESNFDNALAIFTALEKKYYMARAYLERAALKIKALPVNQDADIIAQAEIDLENAKALFRELGTQEYRVRIFELEGKLFMAKRPRTEVDHRMARLAGDLKDLSAQGDLDGLLRYILTYLAEELEADRGVIFMLDENNNVLRIKGTAGVDDATIEDASAISRTIIGQVAGSRRGVFTANASQDNRFKDSASVQLQGIRSLICLPLAAGEELQGVVYLDSREREGLFVEEDLDFAQVFARSAAYEIERRRRPVAEVPPYVAVEPPGVPPAEIVGSSAAVEQLRAAVEVAARERVDVLITGESGTGKELVVRMIHGRSARADEPFIGINCSALPEQLIESELFGIEKGTATGVDKRIGLFERAGEGTVFLDEVGAMDLNTQAKLLRVLQEKQFSRLGSRTGTAVRLKARVVSATNADLLEAIAAGRFREDLYYRLNVFLIECPPLRDHREDITELAAHFVEKYYRGEAARRPRLSAESLDLLAAYDWPGNVRELENCIRSALASTTGTTIEPAALPGRLAEAYSPPRREKADSLHDELARVEREMIVKALQDCGWVRARAARQLGLSESNLRYKIKKYDIKEGEGIRVE